MRAFPLRLLALLTVSVVSGCFCSPPTPSPVTLRIKNGSRDPIWVDVTHNSLGLEVQRSVLGVWTSFDDQPCACDLCDQACGGACQCVDGGTPMMVRIDPGQTSQRTWDGVLQIAGTSSCAFGSGQSCLNQQNAPLDETFNLKLCFVNQVPSFEELDGGSYDGGGVLGRGDFPVNEQTCVDKSFAVRDGVVETGPVKGADCTTTADCKGKGELCFAGSCTASCPANDYPRPSAAVPISVSLDDMGFYSQMPVGTAQVFQGTGKVTSVNYNASTLVAYLLRIGPANEHYTGSITVSFPVGNAAPLAQDAGVTVKLVDKSTSDSPAERAVVVRDSSTGELLLAADVARGGAVLDPADLAPFALQIGEVPIGCNLGGTCGKQLYFTTTFSSGTDAVTLDPGTSAAMNTAGGTYRFLNANNTAYSGTTTCVSPTTPYAIWRAGP